MKLIKLMVFVSVLIVSGLFIISSCNKETAKTKLNGVYIVPLSNKDISESKILLYSTKPYTFDLATAIISPVTEDMSTTIAVDNNLIAGYNTAQNTKYVAMPSGSYTLEATNLTIPKDSIKSQKTRLVIKPDMLTPDVTYLLPIKVASISSNSIVLNPAVATKYYIITSPTPVIGNLSDGKTSILSKGFNPQRGNDGNTNGDWGGGSVCETGAGTEEYWQVDLGGISPRIDTIRIWNRTDCCDDRTAQFYVFISDVPFTGTSVASSKAQAGVYSYYSADKAGRPTEIYPKVSGRYIRLQNSTSASLTLAELTAIGIKP